jgi:anti-sigma factor RsiW
LTSDIAAPVVGWHGHLSDDLIEDYALKRLNEALTAEVEEHLLICERCRCRLQVAERYIDEMRRGLRKLRDQPE